MLALVVSMPSGFSEMKKKIQRRTRNEVTLASFPDSHDILNADVEVVQGVKSLVIFVTCNNEIEIGSEFLEQKGNILHVLFKQLNGSEL